MDAPVAREMSRRRGIARTTRAPRDPSLPAVLASVKTFTLLGVEAHEVSVEVDVAQGLPSFAVVGLPDAAVRESRERVRAAISNSGFDFPQKRITASLAPADLRKAGPGFDLAIAAALLVASEQIPSGVLEGTALAAELALDGNVRRVPGALAMAETAGRAGLERIIVAQPSAAEASLPSHVLNGSSSRVVPVRHLRDLSLLGTEEEPSHQPANGPAPISADGGYEDLADLRGQKVLRGALEVAAAGGHGLFIVGPPGAGKSLAARRLPSIMPPLTEPEAIEVLRIASACEAGPAELPARRPFRAPHHTISPAGLVGGGTPPRAGEVTRAHRGVLFLDELGEFGRSALEALRQPLEDGHVVITRARHSVRLPSRFLLVAASNPCPCGHGDGSLECHCSPTAARTYRNRISGALADRIDISLSVEQPGADALAGEPGESSSAVRERVSVARSIALERQGKANAELAPAELRRFASLESGAKRALADGHRSLGLSGRGHDRVLRVARTLADLRGADRVDEESVVGALGFRRRGAE